MHCPEYVWEMKDLTVNSKIGIFQEKYMDSQNAQNMTRIFKIAKNEKSSFQLINIEKSKNEENKRFPESYPHYQQRKM